MTTKRTTTKSEDGALRAAMARLLKTPMPVLRARFQKATGKEPAGLDRDALVKALASMGAPAAAATAKAPKAGRKTGLRDPRLPAPGTVLSREYKGAAHEVTVNAEGFTYRGKPYRSLTAVAKVLTGYPSISGTAFFGVAKPAATPATAKAPTKGPRKGA